MNPTDKNYPKFVCGDCGRKANRLTCLKKFNHEPTKIQFVTPKYIKSKCGVCGQIKAVTDPKNFFNPDFDLLINNHL